MNNEQLDALLKPKSIAVIGASDKVNSWSLEIHSNLEAFGYQGGIFPVNPGRPTVWGREAFKTLKDVPEPVDLAIIAIPAAAAVDAVAACGEEDIPAAMVVSSGFRDAGAAGALIQEKLVAAATEGKVAVLGPNVEGFINYRDRIASYGAELPPTPTIGSISMFSQSGTAAWAFAHMAGDRGAGLRLVAGVGVEATLGIGDLLVWAAADPETSVVACYIETIRDLSNISRGLEAMARADKPIVLCCPTASGEAARRSVIAHTGELIGDTTLRDAFLRQSGAILVNDPIALFETALLLECASQPISGGVAVAMQSGGNCTLFADALEVAGIPLRDFSPATTDKLAEILPSFSEAQNPLDVTGQAIFDHEIYRKSISALAEDPQVGVVVIDVAPSRRDPDGSPSTEILKHAGEVQSSTRKPIISVLATPLSYPGRTKAPLARHSLTVLHGHAASAQAIAGLMSTSKPRRRGSERRIDRPNLIIPAGLLDETEAAAIFAAYGIERPREFVATSPDGVSDFLEQLGGCVAVKLICASIPHKAREGLVKLDLDTPADARVAAQQIVERARKLGVDSSRLLVQEQLPKGPEFLCGVTVDELYGPALTVRQGGGGVTGESKFHLLPLASGEAAEIAAAAASEVSDRLSEPDLRALTEAVDRFSWLGVDLADRLLEIEANPIIVNNGRAVAVDALAVARDESGVK